MSSIICFDTAVCVLVIGTAGQCQDTGRRIIETRVIFRHEEMFSKVNKSAIFKLAF
jgi:hypothetical protein